MKILPISTFTLPFTQNHAKSRALVFCGKPQDNGDTFTKSTEHPSEEPKPQNIFKQIMDNPVLKQRVMELVTYAAATIAIGAGVDEKTEKPQNSKEAQDLLKNIFSQKSEEEAAESINEEAPIDREESDLNSNIDSENQTEPDSEISESVPEIQEGNEEGLVTIEFPKKRGRLTKTQENLKTAITSINVTPETAEKAEKLCQTLLKNKSVVYNGESTQSGLLTGMLFEDLNKAENQEEKEQVISDYYKQCDLDKEILPAGDIIEEPEPAHEEEELRPAAIAEDTTTTVPELKILGKIDLGDTTRPIHKRKRIHNKAVDRIYSPETGVINKPSNRQVNIEEGVIEKPEGEFTSYRIQIPGTISQDLEENLSYILNHFEKRRVEKNIRWTHKQPMGIISDEDLEDEIQHNRHEYGSRPGRDIHQYNNINEDNISEVVDAINSDPRFGELFTVHSASRFIDRFVDFNDNKLSIEEQCHLMLDKFEEIIQKALKQGELIVDDYKADKTGNFYGAKIIIPEEFFRENKEAAKIFGTNDLTILLCENQPEKGYYNKHNKRALIKTIYPIGI